MCVRSLVLVMVVVSVSSGRRRTRPHRSDFISNNSPGDDLLDPDAMDNFSNNEEVGDQEGKKEGRKEGNVECG